MHPKNRGLLKKKIILFLTLLLITTTPIYLFGQQVFLHGTVYDYYNRKPVESVSVITSSGYGTITDSLGKYSIRLNTKDSVWFSYFGKNTHKYPADTITNTDNFDIGLHIDVPWLPGVVVRNRNYTQDSLHNRQDYAKIFNYKKPGLGLVQANPNNYVPGSVTVGLDLEELINVFRFRRNRRLAAFQKRLLEDEKDKYINHRFNKKIVRQLTKLQNTELESFMNYYKPTYEILQEMNDLELGYFVEQCFKHYQQLKYKRLPAQYYNSLDQFKIN